MPRIFFLLLMVAAPMAFGGDMTFADAKAKADRDEGSLSDIRHLALDQSQAAVVQEGLSTCLGAYGPKPFSFVVVAELDATGKVKRTWRSDETELSACFQGVVTKAKLFVPPQSPFYSFFDMRLTADEIRQ